MNIKETVLRDDDFAKALQFDCLNDDGVSMSHAYTTVRDSRYDGQFIKALLVGGIGTPPQFRRQGCVRALMDAIFAHAEEWQTPVSLLHPFSFSYYRQFGYERISNTTIVSFPITALDFLPRCADLIPYTPEYETEVLALYDRFSRDRNIILRREESGLKNNAYLYRRNGVIEGYLKLIPRNHYDNINRMVSDELYVDEIVFADADALRHLLSFLRMFEGELDLVRLRDLGPVPEIDLMLKHYTHTSYEIHPDIMARVLDTKAMLALHRYPQEPGIFTLKVEDPLPAVRGTFRVAYEKAQGEVTRLDDNAIADLTVSGTALPRFLYGTDNFDARSAAYLDGVLLQNDAPDFFRAFPKQINGLFEHF